MKQVFVQPLTEISLTRKDLLGDLRFERDKIYKYVEIKNVGATVAALALDMVGYFAEVGSEDNHCAIDASDMDAKPIGAGVVLAAVAGVDGVSYFCWIQVTGPVTLATGLGAGSDGDVYQLSTTDKVCIVGAAADDPICCVANDQTADKVTLKCWF